MELPAQPQFPDAVAFSCERCQRRKIKCDRKQPCSRCHKANAECKRRGTGEKQRPARKDYVQALETQVASLELLLQKLAAASSEHRDELLAEYHASSDLSTKPSTVQPAELASLDLGQHALARTRAGRLKKLQMQARNASQFYGGTSLLQIHETRESTAPEEGFDGGVTTTMWDTAEVNGGMHDGYSDTTDSWFEYEPHDEIPRQLLATFFHHQYPYNMCVYREYFLRDYDLMEGPYYSEVLLYAICAMGALACEDAQLRGLSKVFSKHAQSLLYAALDHPDLTILQALILLGQREIGHGHASKGWLFCGMAFRLTHEMGLHLDPNNWNDGTQPSVDTEVLRRVYWTAFILDKQLSLYFGRPPALYPQESDVRNTIRIPYPPEWESLLDTYVAKGLSAEAYEDGIALAGSVIYQVELCKILHNMISRLYENRRAKADAAIMATMTQQIHVSLVGWLSSLPGKLHWNQWTVGQVPACVLHLHMLFHTAMIILHRPPSHFLRQPGMSASEDVEICYESLRALIRLMRCYSRFYHYRSLPLDFVHTLSTAAGVILMKRYLDQAPADDSEISKSFEVVLEAMAAIKATWPCIGEIEDCVLQAMQKQAGASPQADPILQLGFEVDFPSMLTSIPSIDQLQPDVMPSDLGFLVTDDALASQFSLSWDSVFADFAGPSGPG